MVPREAGRGRSFKGAGQYYLHDKDAATRERIGFTHAENVPTQDPDKALKWMAWTAINADELKRESGATINGQSCGKPVFTFSLAWHPEEDPKKWEMVGAGRTALQALGLERHEALMISHNDRPHPHMHVIVNVIDPETGKAHSLPYSRLKLSEWAEDYERQHGKIYCDQRVENNARRKEGKYVEYEEPEVDLKTQITQLYQQSDCGAAFQAGLAELGYTLAKGKRIVLVDSDGEIHNISRQIDGANTREIRAKLGDIELPTVDDVQDRMRETSGSEDQRKPEPQLPEEAAEPQEPDPEPFDRDQQDRDWQESIVDAAIAADQAKKPPAPRAPTAPSSQRRSPPSPIQLNALQDRHHAELSRFYTDNTHARQRLRQTLDQQYGEHEQQLRQDIERLDDALANSGAIRRLWLKLSGQLPRNAEEELENQRRTLQNIEWRRSEAEQVLDRQIEQRRQAIEARQHAEREALQSDPAPVDLQDYRAGPNIDVGQDAPDEDQGPSLSF